MEQNEFLNRVIQLAVDPNHGLNLREDFLNLARPTRLRLLEQVGHIVEFLNLYFDIGETVPSRRLAD